MWQAFSWGKTYSATVIINIQSFALLSVTVCKINVMVTLGKGPEKNLMYMTSLWPRALGELLLKGEVPVLLAFRETAIKGSGGQQVKRWTVQCGQHQSVL